MRCGVDLHDRNKLLGKVQHSASSQDKAVLEGDDGGGHSYGRGRGGVRLRAAAVYMHI